MLTRSLHGRPRWPPRAPRRARPLPDYVALRHDPYSSHQLVLNKARGAARVLDVGCSAGVLARDLAAGGAVVDGIEYDAIAAEEARAVCRTVLVGDLDSMDLAGLDPAGYDAVICADILEHLRDPVAVLARLRGTLAPGGRLIVSVPNIANWSMRLLHLAGRWSYTERGIMDRTHLRFFNRRGIVETVEAAGFAVDEVDVSVPLPVLRREPFNRLAHGLGRAWKNFFAYQFVVTAKPRLRPD